MLRSAFPFVSYAVSNRILPKAPAGVRKIHVIKRMRRPTGHCQSAGLIWSCSFIKLTLLNTIGGDWKTYCLKVIQLTEQRATIEESEPQGHIMVKCGFC